VPRRTWDARQRTGGRKRLYSMRFSRPAAILAAMVTVALTAAGLPAAAAGAPSTDPAVFAAGISCGTTCARLAVLSSRTGEIVRWLTPRVNGTDDDPVSIRGGWVYFSRISADRTGIWRVPLTGGTAQPVQAGTVNWSMSQDGRAVAYVVSNRYREELVTRNLTTGQRDSITIAANPAGNDNNWPPGVAGLTWSPDDRQLALALQPTAAISSVLVLGAFTATSISDATTAPARCPVAGKPSEQCTETDPAYLADGALSYVIQQTADRGGTATVTTSLVAWRDGRSTTLRVFAGGLSQQYDMTAQGQAIWVSDPAKPGGPWPIWCWSGGSVTKIVALPAADSPAMVVWLPASWVSRISCRVACRPRVWSVAPAV
jgi:hypothetical protein